MVRALSAPAWVSCGAVTLESSRGNPQWVRLQTPPSASPQADPPPSPCSPRWLLAVMLVNLISLLFLSSDLLLRFPK